MDIIREKWNDILEMVRQEHEITSIAFQTWLSVLEIHEVSKNTVTILVPLDEYGLKYIKRRFMFPLKVAIAEITGTEYEINFITPESIAGGKESSDSQKSVDPEKSRLLASSESAGLFPNYTFDTFVVGNNNRFAQAACLAVAESPGKVYNPLFIYGGAGLGKTHLMNAIAHHVLENSPGSKVLYVTSEQFTNEVITAIRNSNNTAMNAFREKYRKVDVLLIDDIQFIIGKESTQEEFFHTFNDLHSNNKQIVLSSDKPPKEIDELEDRFRTRFEWGIIVDVSMPDYETRSAILQQKMEQKGCDISSSDIQDVIKYISTNIKSSVRALEGALNKLFAARLLYQGEINLELAEIALRDIISPNQPKVATPELILETVAEHFHITISDIEGPKRTSNINVPRQIFMYLCQDILGTPLQTIGSYIGNRDHSTVKHGIDKIRTEMEQSESLRSHIEVIRKKIYPV